MLWINNQLVEEKDALPSLNLKGRVRPDGAVTLQVPQTGGSINVKVGQSVEMQTGRVAEIRRPEAEGKPGAEGPRRAAADPSRAAARARAAPQADPPSVPAGARRRPAGAERKPAAGAVGLKLDMGSARG